jgi:hypothetical protein
VKGHWVDLDLAWSDTAVVHCDVCGRLIPRRSWMFEGGAGELRACAPSCEELYTRYILPSYGVRSSDANH